MSYSISSENMSRIKMGVIVVGAVAGVYGITRIVLNRRAAERQYSRRMEKWLSKRIGDLSGALGLVEETSESFAKEIQKTTRICMKYLSKARKSKRGVGGLINMAFEQQILKMKKRVNNLLDLTESSHEKMLHNFYEELRGWLIPIG